MNGQEFGIVHLDRDQAQAPAFSLHKIAEPAPCGIEALHVADLHDPTGLVACGDDAIGVRDRIAERLLAEDVQPVLKPRHRQVRVITVRRRDHDGIKSLCKQCLGVGEGRYAVALAKMHPHLLRRVGEADDVEALGHGKEVRQVLDLRDEAAADDADLDPMHR